MRTESLRYSMDSDKTLMLHFCFTYRTCFIVYVIEVAGVVVLSILTTLCDMHPELQKRIHSDDCFHVLFLFRLPHFSAPSTSSSYVQMLNK